MDFKFSRSLFGPIRASPEVRRRPYNPYAFESSVRKATTGWGSSGKGDSPTLMLVN